jgi:hypothetical protein
MLDHQPAKQACPAARCFDQHASAVCGVAPAANEASPLTTIDESDGALVSDLKPFGKLRDRRGAIP